ncbi:MAG TPA: UDP-glucose 4-epimerase GalE [Candidatus Caccocola faecipullorum]|nr:UDP-glucose 4-epimerase GalE [Candidatus Caccocola faecipullorum]
MKNCVVTGGAGYVGSHCCKELAKAGYNPVTVDNLFRGHRELVKWGPFCECDVLDTERLSKIFEEYRPEAVFHFAGLTYVGESVEHPEDYYRVNTAGTLSLLSAMMRGGCDKIIFSSTAATYGNPLYTPIDEKHPQSPINPYGASKLFIERMMEDFSSAHGIKFAALRYFNASGADPECETGELHEPETHLIPLIIFAALGRRADIKIFGRDYDTPDGTAVRDYVHVTDLASAHLKALEKLKSDGKNLKLNLGTGSGYSVLEVIKSVERVSVKKVPAHDAPRRAGDPPVLVADSTAAQQTLGWQLKHSSIDEIVETAIRWHERH